MGGIEMETQEVKEESHVQKKPRILVVDDNVELLEEVEHMLDRKGYEVDTLNDGGMVFEEALKEKPDVILLDLKMSPKSGFQIADELTHSFVLKDIPIIAMTGFFTDAQHYLMMKLCGIKTVILKPLKPPSLISKIEFALGRRLQDSETEGT